MRVQSPARAALAGAMVIGTVLVASTCGKDSTGPAPAGPAAKLAFTVQPSNVAAGAAIAPAVQVVVQDAQGNTVTTSTASITVAITSGTGTTGAVLGGTLTQAAGNGVATFANLTIDRVGAGYTVTGTATSLTSATSTAFTVTPGAAAKLALTVQPSNVAAGAAIAPAVQVVVQDAQGNTVTSATTSITVAITSGTGTAGAVLGGTLTQAAASGVATFSNLTIDKGGAGYTLTVSAVGLTSAVSNALNVTTATITAPSANLLVGATVTFSGSVSGVPVWAVNGVVGGSGRFGTITSAGVYTAPPIVPTGNPVTIRVASAAAPGDSASVPLTIVPSTSAGQWTAWQPRIVNAARTDSVALLVHTSADVTRVELAPAGGAPSLVFRHLGGQVYQLDLSRAQVLGSYVTGDFHNFVGFIDLYAGSTRVLRGNSFASVRDAMMPDAPVTSLAADAAATSRVLNVRTDSVPATGVNDALATQRLYQLFPDNYDFVAVVQPVSYYQNRYYSGIRNATTGIGLGAYDMGATYGSASRLQGVVHYPIDGFFDLGEQAAVHEIGHRWINFLSNTPLGGGSPHWPVSTLASSVMGFNIPGSTVGGNFNYVFQPNGDGTYKVLAAPDTGRFYDLELYLMGLLPKDSVGPHFVFQNQAQFPIAPGGNAAGPVTTVTVDDIIAAQGARVPAYGSAQTTFRVATVVLSTGVLLSADEMAFFDHMTARGEATERLRFTSGFASGMSRPFYVATGGRGQLATTLR